MKRIYLLFSAIVFSGIAMAQCGNVTNLVASSVTPTSVNLNWDITTSAIGYEYAVTTSATPPASGTATTNTFVTPVSGLTPATVYYVHVRSNCGSGDFGIWSTISFSTACSPASIPYSENFDGVTAPAIPFCVHTEDRNGATTWTNSTGLPHSSPNNMVYSFDAATPANDWFFTAPLGLTGGTSYRLSFWYRVRDASLPEKFEVKYGTPDTANVISGGVTILGDTTIDNDSYVLFARDFTPASTGTYFIGFHATSPADRWELHVDDINVDLTPSCSPPISVDALVTSSTSASVSFSPSTGTSYQVEYGPVGFVHGAGTIVAGTGSPIAITGITLPDTTLDFYVRQVCSGIPGPWSLASARLLRNDDAAGALLLTIGAGCLNAPFTNLNSTASTNEVYPSCSGSKEAPIWFKFRAPASGAVRISTDIGSSPVGFYDTKVGLFSATDSSNYSTFTILSCDDDGGSNTAIGGEGYASVVYATGLTPNAEYWIAVDKFMTGGSGSSGNFCITVDELNSSMLASTANTCGTSIESPVGANPAYKGWIPLVDDADSRLIALIKDTSGTTVEDYDVSMNVNSGAIRSVNGQNYLDRNFHLDSAGVSTANSKQVQFFFLASELTSLHTSDSATVLSNLGVSKQPGATCQGDFNIANGAATYLTQTGNGSINGASWISITTNSFSNFYLHASRASLPIKVLLQGACPNTGTVTQHRLVTSTWANVLNTYALEQPYDSIGYDSYHGPSYGGKEHVSPGFFTSTGTTTDIVDWVLLELRNGNPGTVVARRAAFVRVDGQVVDLDGVSAVSFRGVPSGSYYLDIRHRNHLGIRSSVVQVVDGALGAAAGIAYDFTTAQSKAYQNPAITANPAMRAMTGGTFALWAGNANAKLTVQGNGSVRASGAVGGPNAVNDLLYILNSVLAGSTGLGIGPVYNTADINMDGTVRASGTSGGPNPTNDYLILLNTILGGNTGLGFQQHR